MKKRVYKDNPRSFCFTKNQSDNLLINIRGKRSNPDKEYLHKQFVEITTQWTGIWLEAIQAEIYFNDQTGTYEIAKCREELRKKYYHNAMTELIGKIKALRLCLLDMPEEIVDSLGMTMVGNLHSKASKYLSQTILDYRHFENNPLKMRHTSTLLLTDIMALMEDAAEEVAEEYKDDGGSQKTIFKFLIMILVDKYEEIYGKVPSYSRGTKFYEYMATIAESFSLTISPGLVRNLFIKYHVTA